MELFAIFLILSILVVFLTHLRYKKYVCTEEDLDRIIDDLQIQFQKELDKLSVNEHLSLSKLLDYLNSDDIIVVVYDTNKISKKIGVVTVREFKDVYREYLDKKVGLIYGASMDCIGIRIHD